MMKLQMLKRALIAYVANSVKAIWSALAYPLTIPGGKNGNVADYRIYGNSVQNGEPTPDNPAEVQSVGEYDEEIGKYKVPITVRGKNIFKPYRVSATSIRKNVPPALTNNYGTTIDTTDLSDNSVKVTQVPNESYSADAYQNGYICIQTEGLTVGKKYRLSFDIDILENPLNVSRFVILAGGAYPTTSASFSSTKQRVSCVFTEKLSAQTTAYPYLEIRCMGMSFIASNFMITEEGYDSEYEPYIEPQTVNIYLDEPIGAGVYVQKSRDGLPPLPQFKGTTIYETQTEIPPSGIEVQYYG